jgi:hypothetical protein
LLRTEVLVDGGIRWGSDIVKALCLGARGVLTRRPTPTVWPQLDIPESCARWKSFAPTSRELFVS